ncbi:ATP-dependent dethiobiotin synthetase BioD [Rhodococcus rhodnii]|uniref:ATP-dependent dethiobiotin synthetase BioD n=2 Tax=Rhodococcus rhodnii TaxID=38312 RepID=R7WTK0_9NOCA|nr:dethiobiotin synthase [Rhodococcus rhodnii]EOM78596.1 dithiobiotin synthetase [Rhodococcus rhodnii LMG 5362]TXG91377.1 ATP-dependent dethiobiotin synthetase BioD [Rhodococcus rhodnii]
MSIVVVAGTGTDVGKTIVTAALAAAARAAGARVVVCKPAQTGVRPGEPGDIAMVERLTGIRGVELVRYRDPLAPDTAARREGAPMLRRETVTDAVRELADSHDLVLVEGAGGVLVRFGENGFTLCDVARDLGAPAVVTVAPGLGTLNHTALTTETLAARGVACAGLVVGSWPRKPDLAMRCNLEDLPDVAGASLVGTIPAGAGALAPSEFVRDAPGWFAAGWDVSRLSSG